MYPAAFAYHRATSLDDALAHLAAEPEARILAGGQSLIPMMKLRLATPAALVDIGSLPGLAYLTTTGETLHIGALTRHRDIQAASLPPSLQIMHDAASVIADVQVRNRGTLCGSLAQADPGGDWAPVMMALDAELDIVGASGIRCLRAREFFVDFYTTALEPGELLREVRVRIAQKRTAGAYLALKRRAGDFAMAAVAVQLTLDDRGRCESAGIGLGSVGATAICALDAERVLIGSDPNDKAVLAEAGEAASAASSPSSDNNGSEEYKRELVAVLTRRAVEIAARRCRGETVNALDHV